MSRGLRMNRGLSAALLAVTLAAPLAAPAQSNTQSQVNTALRADAEIWNSLTALAIARELGDRCPSIEARTLRGRTHVLGLYNRARALGYTRQQIVAFIDDRDEKARLRTEVTAWFAARGLREGAAAQGFCDLGQREISTGTLAGSFLRAR